MLFVPVNECPFSFDDAKHPFDGHSVSTHRLVERLLCRADVGTFEWTAQHIADAVCRVAVHHDTQVRKSIGLREESDELAIAQHGRIMPSAFYWAKE